VLRIRDNKEATVKRIDIPKDKLEVLQKIVAANVSEVTKELAIKKLVDGLCCVCRGIPAYMVSYPVRDGGATKIERYCEKCARNVFERQPVP
jgi:hypothetical protein